MPEIADDPEFDGEMPDEAREEIDDAVIQRALTGLLEHFESVHVFVSRYRQSDGGTISYNKGDGNWHARTGQIRAFLQRTDEAERMNARRAIEQQDDDE